MKLLALAVWGFFVGCSGDTDGILEQVAGDVNHQGGELNMPDHRSGNGGPCSNAFEVVDVQGVNGQSMEVIVPIPCDPSYLDKGDPPPSDRSPLDTYTDPVPDTVTQQVVE